MTWGGAAPSDPSYGAATYTHVDQGSPVLASNTNATDASTPNPLTTTVQVTADGMAIGAAFCGNQGTFSWGNGWIGSVEQNGSASAAHSGPDRLAIVAASLSVAR